MTSFYFNAGDVIVFADGATGWYGKLKRWLMNSRWGHVAIFYMHTKRGLSLIIESIGDGVRITALESYRKRDIAVYRHPNFRVGWRAAKAAERLADNPDSFYDYSTIVRWILPRLVLAKFGLPHKYRRDRLFVCSELVAEAFWEADVDVVPRNKAPLPDDFTKTEELNLVWQGNTEEFVIPRDEV